jgi:putative toxin-antitoxin system antitoxin component (TIGR02293 family)
MRIKEPEIAAMLLNEAESPSYNLSDAQSLQVAEVLRTGLSWDIFTRIAASMHFNLSEWAQMLHISERTLQRQKKDTRAFQGLEAERVIEIALLFRFGRSVFGTDTHFRQWLDLPCVALGNIRPFSLLESAFGIRLLREELIRIEHGVFA